MEEKAFIQIRQLKKSFLMGKQLVRAVDGVDLDIPRGSFTIIMGPSGSGKSTLLYQIGGLDQPSSGSIEVDGIFLEKMDENALAIYRRQKIGFIFQSFNLLPTMSALENVAFPMRFSGVSAASRHKIAQDLLKRVGLEKRAHHKPTELSGGQQQRVAVARSLVNNPILVLADEPTGNLDTSSGYSIMKLLAELHADGRTIIVVTHDPRMVGFATHTIYLLDGHSVSEEVYQAASAAFNAESEKL